MKNPDMERLVSFCRYAVMPYYYKYPELDMTLSRPNAAYEKAFYAPCPEEPGGYAQNTTAWD